MRVSMRIALCSKSTSALVPLSFSIRHIPPLPSMQHRRFVCLVLTPASAFQRRTLLSATQCARQFQLRLSVPPAATSRLQFSTMPKAAASPPSTPSQTVTAYWVWARSSSKPLKSSPRTGKWMLFYPKAILDAKWATVKQLVEHDQLGGLAKCSTAMPNPNATNNAVGVIIVYTSDFEDQEEVYDVAVKLHEALEYKKPMYYKSDEQTIAGLYAKNGSKKNHIYKYPLD